jgi:uncharacterized membrane protein YccC
MTDNESMSRGWESKSVESQMEEAAARRAAAPGQTPPTPEQLRIGSARESLELSRKRVLNDLEAATHPRRREQLAAALRHLEQKLAALNTMIGQSGAGSQTKPPGPPSAKTKKAR